MKVTVFGGTGYLGELVTDRCHARGHEVVALSRNPGRGAWEHRHCDFTAPSLGMDEDTQAVIAGSDVCVVAVGGVSWQSTGAASLQIHDRGIATLLQLVESAPQPPRIVHVSSILALGEPNKTMTSDQLYVGQRFRNWYEYGKYVAEHRVRNSKTQHNIVRFGPLLGLGYEGRVPSTQDGLPALFPMVLANYPVPITEGGRYPCYVGDVLGAAELVAEMVEWTAHGRTLTWFDPQTPSLVEILSRVCLPFGKYPRLLKADVTRAEWLLRMAMRRIGTDANLTDYAHRWIDVDCGADLEHTTAAHCRVDYIQAMSAAMAGHAWPDRSEAWYAHA
ncbi:NAD(P)-dependent oxidoreductase [Antrihabitans sp. YC3-6]|uniref:NAD(P)-dependent oxidoreductase n=1 Tax=Antrihabitans stalagmiti TaxID=2799499 RepID=A0A934U175_9NOCA|nr:NAD(P)-dependent oxidoreductase [Antrihabitans stalagmiti]MBJ8338100.1 NAD(P)-dependent oxidoreductase [Antrihabitans stalagmiti]